MIERMSDMSSPSADIMYFWSSYILFRNFVNPLTDACSTDESDAVDEGELMSSYTARYFLVRVRWVDDEGRVAGDSAEDCAVLMEVG